MAATALFAAVASPPPTAQIPTPPSGSQAQRSDHPGITLRTSDVINAKVFSLQGEELGRIRDALFDPKTGTISHAVLGMGGWQGIGEKLAIIPWQLIKQDEQRTENYVLQVDREKLRTAPTFESNQWATVIQPDYLAKVQSYYMAASQPQPPPELQTTPKAKAEPPPSRQAEERVRKETQQAEQKQRQSSGGRGMVETDK